MLRGLFNVISDELVCQLFRAPHGPSTSARGWPKHVGCHLFDYVSNRVLPLIRAQFVLLNEDTRQALSVDGSAFAPYTREELVHEIGSRYSEFVTGGNSDLQPIVYLTNLSRLNGRAGSYSYFRYGGPSQPVMPNPIVLALQTNSNLMKEVDLVIPDKFWVVVAKAQFPQANGPAISLNVRYMFVGFLLHRFCSNNLPGHPTVEVCNQMLDYKITRSFTLRDLCRRHGLQDVERKVHKELIINARKACFFTKKGGYPPFPSVMNERKRSQLQAQWRFVSELSVEGPTGEGVDAFQRSDFRRVFDSRKIKAMLAAASICITDEYIRFLFSLQDEYDDRRRQLYNLSRAEGQSVPLPNLLEEWNAGGLPLSVSCVLDRL